MIAITDTLTGQFILACWGIFLAFWLVTALFVKPTAQTAPREGTAILVRMVLGIAVLLTLGRMFPVLNEQLWGYSTTMGIVADVCAGAGLLLMLWARVTLGRNWSALVVLRQDHELVERGPYAVIRHPIYAGLLLLFLGEGVWYGSVAWLLLFLIVTAAFWYKAQVEETFMTHHFPVEYPRYKARTKALIPFVL
jgi:protein-S-isoprenylcysteine O-methyltransferase Ste14